MYLLENQKEIIKKVELQKKDVTESFQACKEGFVK